MASVFKRGGKSNRGGKYYAAWFDHTGRRRTKSTGTTDKAAAERIARRYESDAALRRDGVIDPATEAIGTEAKRSVESHLSDYESKLRTAGRTDKHVTSTVGIVRSIAEFTGYAIASDIGADGVHRYAGYLRTKGGPPARSRPTCPPSRHSRSG